MVIECLTCDFRHVLKSKHKSNLKLWLFVKFALFLMSPLKIWQKRIICSVYNKKAMNDSDRPFPRLSVIHVRSEPWVLTGRMLHAAWTQAAELLPHVCEATKIFFLCSSDLKAPKNVLHILIHYFFNFCKLKNQRNWMFGFSFFMI